MTAGGSIVSTHNTKNHKVSSPFVGILDRSAQRIIEVCKLYTTIVGTWMTHILLSNGTSQFNPCVSLLCIGRCLNISQNRGTNFIVLFSVPTKYLLV
jgi:hypothetical protein